MGLLYYITLSSIIVAFLSSLVSFRLDYPYHLRLFSIFLGFIGICELTSLIYLKVFHINLALYNIIMAIEFYFYAFFYRLILFNSVTRRVLSWFFICFPVFCYIVIRLFGIQSWNSYLAVFGALFTIYLSIACYYELFNAPTLVKLGTSAEFWIATALIIYYSGNLPYTGMMHFLYLNFPRLAGKFVTLLQILNIVMYSTFTYAYLCRIPIRKS